MILIPCPLGLDGGMQSKRLKREDRMKAHLKAKGLTEILNVIGAIINPKATELVRRQVLLTFSSDGQLEAKTVNEHAVLIGNLSVKVDEPGKVCVDIVSLSGLVSKFSGDITVQTIPLKGASGEAFQLKANKSEYKIPLFPVDEFEPLSSYKEIKAESFTVDLKQLKDALECVYNSSAKDDDTLSGAYISHDSGHDSLLCSNIQVGAVVHKENLANIPTGVLPRFIIDFILKLPETRIMEYMTEDGFYVGKVGAFRFAYRTPKVEYPIDDLTGCINQFEDAKSSFSFNKSHLDGALNRICLVTDEKTHAVQISVAGRSMEISVDGPGYSGKEIVDLIEPVDFKYSILVDASYMVFVLREFMGNVDWHFTDSESVQFIRDGFLLKFFMGLVE